MDDSPDDYHIHRSFQFISRYRKGILHSACPCFQMNSL